MSQLPLVALFGGSFDPVHRGHEAIVGALCQQLSPQRVLVVPCHVPPHKSGLYASPEHRMAMLEAAFKTNALVDVSDREIQQDSTSYTINTLEDIRKTLGEQVSVCFVMGMDSWQNFRTWCRWQDILSHAHLILVSRPGVDSLENIHRDDQQLAEVYTRCVADISALTQRPFGAIVSLNMDEVDVASTDVRACLMDCHGSQIAMEERKSLYLSQEVSDYIAAHKLYQKTEVV